MSNNEKKYVDDVNVQTAMAEYIPNLHKRSKVRTQNGTYVGRVGQVYDSTNGHGEQVYAIVPEQGFGKDPKEVSEVTVLFRGSTGFGNYKIDWTRILTSGTTPIGLPDQTQSSLSQSEQITNTDVLNDWLRADAGMAYNILNPSKTNVTAQLEDASADFNAILKQYPNAKVKVYGHSLGAMNTQYALANMPEKDTHRIIGGWAYNGPNIYTELSEKQKKLVATNLKGKLQIYYDPTDIVGLAYTDVQGKPLPAIGTVYQVKSKKVGLVNQHMTYGYQLDKNGQIKIVNTNPATASLNLVVSGMSAYYSLKVEREQHGLTSNEEFFLDSTQASVVATGLVKAAETVKDEVEAAKKRAVEEAEELYQSTKTAPFGITELSPEEIQEAYAAAGVTYDSIVGKTERHFDKKVGRAEKIVTAYSELQGKIQAGVNDAFAKDASLAGKFQQWSVN